MATKPFSLRLHQKTITQLGAEASRRRVPPRALAQEILEEGLRMRRHPLITFVDKPWGRTAVLASRPRLRVAHIVETASQSASVEEAADYFNVTVAEVEAALDYYRDHRKDIDAEIAADTAAAEEGEKAFRERQALLRR